MESVRTKVGVTGIWRLQRFCCCCSLKMGSTVIGVWEVIALIRAIRFPSLEYERPTDSDEDSVVNTIQGETFGAWIVAIIVHVIVIVLTACMVYGNIKGNTRWMMPYVYVKFIVLAIVLLFSITAALCFLLVGEMSRLFFSVIVPLCTLFCIELYVWQVVRCRTLELEELEQPGVINQQSGAIFSQPGVVVQYQRDPELPTYGNVQNTGDIKGAFGGVQGAYGNVAGSYQNVPAAYGNVAGAHQNVPGAYGNMVGAHQNVPVAYGNVPGAYQNVPVTYENVAGAYQNVPGAYANVAGGYGNVPGTSENIPSAHGNVPATFGNVQDTHVNVPSTYEKRSELPPPYTE